MTVKGQDIHAFLRNDSNDSSLDHAIADGRVEAHETALERRASFRTCRILCGRRQSYPGGRAAAIYRQPARNHPSQKLTWYSSDDRLLVNGVAQAACEERVCIVRPAPSNFPMRTLQTSEISKSYRGRKVVDNVSLWVKQGEVVGLLGPNGAGKTTSFYIIVGLISPDSGSVLVSNGDGSEDITNMPMYQRAQRGISYLPQELRFSASSRWKTI